METAYWRPTYDWIGDIVNRVSKIVREGDFLVVSEKAISVATGQIIDEACIEPTCLAKLLAIGWMRIVWGRILGRLCHLSRTNIARLVQYPVREGAAHKQLAIDHVGLLQALRHGSEGGIDTSNLPFSIVALPLEDPRKEAAKLRDQLLIKTGKKVTVLVVDSDKTYSFRNFHISVRQTTVREVRCLGLFAYMLGRSLRLRPRSTPLATVGEHLTAEEALQVSAVANRARGSGAGRTAWDMGERFHVKPHEVTWDMLETIRHVPAVVVRRVRSVH